MASARSTLLDGLSAPLAELGVDLEDIEVTKAGRRHVVRVVIDRDGGVDLDLVAAVSQRVSELLDAPPMDSAIDGAFVLEVTSPGVDRPLTLPRHWRRARTRLVRVTMADGTEVEGRVSDVPDDENVVLTIEEEARRIPLGDVVTAIVQIEFNRKEDQTDGEE